MKRPLPPEDLLGTPTMRADGFDPAEDLEEWVKATFLDQQGSLFNEDHRHLGQAAIAFLWAAPSAFVKGREIVGTAEVFNPRGSGWQKSRQEWQMLQWFGPRNLDFLITIDAPYAQKCSDLAFCSLIEHELYHCAQATDQWGMPRFNQQTGRPVYTIRGHDAEEFVGVVRRYGVGAAAGGVRELVEAANRTPEVGAAHASAACGNCLRLVA